MMPKKVHMVIGNEGQLRPVLVLLVRCPSDTPLAKELRPGGGRQCPDGQIRHGPSTD